MKRAALPSLLMAASLFVAACGSGESAITAGQDDPDDVTTTEPPDQIATGDDTGDETGDETGSTTAPDDTETTDPGAAGGDGDAGGSDDEGATTAPDTAPTEIPLDGYPDCPTGALDDVDAADAPVQITYWHGMTAENEEALQAITEQYNASQDRVVVELQNQGGYLEVIDKYYQSGDNGRPDLVMFPEYGFQQAIDSDTVIPVEVCVRDAGFDTSPIQPSAVQAYSSAGVHWAMPFNVSNPILYFNKQMFEAAGLDPEQPPTTFDELRAMSQQLVDSGVASYGIALDTSIDSGGGWFLEQWFANAGELFVDNGNGRESLPTEVLFDQETGVEIVTFLRDLIDDGLAVNVGDNAGGSDNFLKMADTADPAAMTIGTSAGLGTVINVLGSGLVEGLTPNDVGVGGLPGLAPEQTAIVGGAANFVVAGKDPEITAATWDFVTYLITPEVQSQWAVQTGYLPIVDEAIDLEPLRTTYADDPRFRVAYTQLANSPDDLAHAGPQIGPHRQVRDQTAAALASIFNGGDIESTLTDAAATSDALLQQYIALNG
ncbi:MAG: hypothetical protein CL424_12780 [Acidimicrobiaceae bacterium]|nr:hypothetical protein [Acidimicrobiaceae bacterium]